MNYNVKKLFILLSMTLLTGCDSNACIISVSPVSPFYLIPESIIINGDDFSHIEKTDPNYPSFEIVNDELKAFVIKKDDEEKFKEEYPGFVYFSSNNFSYYRHDSRMPLYSLLGDNQQRYLSTPDKDIYIRSL